MTKTILITGATDGSGLETARQLAPQGHTLLIHGRNMDKFDRVKVKLSNLEGSGKVEADQADFSRLSEVKKLAQDVAANHQRLDIRINNAGVYNTRASRTDGGCDLRFAVNTLAPALSSRELQTIIPESGRIVSQSSAAQSPVELGALRGETPLASLCPEQTGPDHVDAGHGRHAHGRPIIRCGQSGLVAQYQYGEGRLGRFQ